MYVQVEKKREKTSQSITNAVYQKPNSGKSSFQFIDNRLQYSAQRKLQKIASYGQIPPIRIVGTGRVVDNQVVQRLKGAKGTAQEGKAVPYTINQEFITKHVANDIEEAVSVTEARIKTGGPPGIVAGTASNNLAKEADWKSAIDNSDVIVPPDSEWSVEFGDMADNWVERLAKVEVAGWEAKGTKGNVTAKIATNKKYLGGKWTVSDCKYDKDSDYVNASGKVKMDISHLTS